MSGLKNIRAWVAELLAQGTSVDRQCELIAHLSSHLYDGAVLAEIVRSFRQYEHVIEGLPEQTVDIVGTGGDGANTLNYSTMAALLLIKMGVPVAKHGNKSATSLCGSFDLLMNLNVPIPETVVQAKAVFAEKGGVFLFAPYFHPIFQRIAAARKRFSNKGERTVFNILGPLLNPAHVRRMVVGVYQPELLIPFAEALTALGVEYTYVVHGNGLDEASLTGTTHFIRCEQGRIISGQWQPDDLGFAPCHLSDLAGGKPQYNMQQTQAILSGALAGPKQQMVILNAALAMHASSGFSRSLSSCLDACSVAFC